MSEEEKRADEPTGDDASKDGARDLTERWKAWQREDEDSSPEAQQLEKQARSAQRREAAAEDRQARAIARREAKQLARVEREERAKRKREERETARMRSAEEREEVRRKVVGFLADLRRSAAVIRDEGIGALIRAAFRRRWVVAVSLVILMLVSAFAGAMIMRARHRAYLTAVLVAVNGQTIRRDQLNDEMHRAYGAQVLDTLVQRELRRQFLKKHGAVATDKQIDERLRLEARSPEFMPILQKAGKSEAEYREPLARVLGEINLVSKGVTVSEAELRDFYARNVNPQNAGSLFYSPEVVTLAVIAAASKADADAARQALTAGADWASVARRYSVDDTAQNGGLMQPFAVGRSLTAHAKGLDAVARRLEQGQQVGPIRIGGLWWLVRCLEKQAALTRPYDEVKETVRVLALAAKGEKENGPRLAAEYEEFRKKANIQTFLTR